VNLRIARVFEKDFKRNRDAALEQRVRSAIHDIQNAESLSEATQMKQLAGYQNCFRIRVGDYRIGLYLDGDTVVFARFLHRKEIYRYFP
jgi:mRNA interferase RelE/StbE